MSKRDWFVEAFGQPIADIRAKLIDEAWFGRRVNEPGRSVDRSGIAEDHARFSNAAVPDRDAHRHGDHDHDFER